MRKKAYVILLTLSTFLIVLLSLYLAVKNMESTHNYMTLQELEQFIKEKNMSPSVYIVAKCKVLTDPNSKFLFDIRDNIVWVGKKSDQILPPNDDPFLRFLETAFEANRDGHILSKYTWYRSVNHYYYWRPFFGRCLTKLNSSWVRLHIAFPEREYIDKTMGFYIDLPLPTRSSQHHPSSQYVHASSIPGNLTLVKIDKKPPESLNTSITVYTFYNQNPLDARILKDLLTKVSKIVEKHDLPRNAVFWIFTTEILQGLLNYDGGSGKEHYTINVTFLDNDSLETTTIPLNNHTPNSYLNILLLKGKGVCHDYAVLASEFANLAGFDTYEYIHKYTPTQTLHAILAVNISDAQPIPTVIPPYVTTSRMQRVYAPPIVVITVKDTQTELLLIDTTTDIIVTEFDFWFLGRADAVQLWKYEVIK